MAWAASTSRPIWPAVKPARVSRVHRCRSEGRHRPELHQQRRDWIDPLRAGPGDREQLGAQPAVDSVHRHDQIRILDTISEGNPCPRGPERFTDVTSARPTKWARWWRFDRAASDVATCRQRRLRAAESSPYERDPPRSPSQSQALRGPTGQASSRPEPQSRSPPVVRSDREQRHQRN